MNYLDMMQNVQPEYHGCYRDNWDGEDGIVIVMKFQPYTTEQYRRNFMQQYMPGISISDVHYEPMGHTEFFGGLDTFLSSITGTVFGNEKQPGILGSVLNPIFGKGGDDTGAIGQVLNPVTKLVGGIFGGGTPQQQTQQQTRGQVAVVPQSNALAAQQQKYEIVKEGYRRAQRNNAVLKQEVLRLRRLVR